MQQSSTFTVVVNHRNQYSIWDVGRQLPAGWSQVGREGTKEQCLSYIEEIWVDMRPPNVRSIDEGKKHKLLNQAKSTLVDSIAQKA